MAASLEYTQWHLTPQGWIRGTEKTDFSYKAGLDPDDRVLTATYKEESNGYAPAHSAVTENWRSSDQDAVHVLLAKFGPAPNRL